MSGDEHGIVAACDSDPRRGAPIRRWSSHPAVKEL